MLTLLLRTDKPEAEIAICGDHETLHHEEWEAHRALAETLHSKIAESLKKAEHELKDLTGIVVFQGPGSFTGLRIGMTVANALANSLNISIVATQTEEWQQLGLARLQNDENDRIALPEYGAPVHITTQKK